MLGLCPFFFLWWKLASAYPFYRVQQTAIVASLTLRKYSPPEAIETILHRIKSQRGRSLKWAEIQEKNEKTKESDQAKYDDAKAYAEKLWSEGDKCLDYQMVRFLKSVSSFSDLDETRLRREIETPAENSNRCSGFRGGKKPKK